VSTGSPSDRPRPGRRVVLTIAAVAAALGSSAARADGFARLAEGAPLYVATRPLTLVALLQRLGLDQLPSVQKLRRNLGGIDPFNPAVLALPGIDVQAPVVASVFTAAGPNQLATRVVAQVRDRAVFGLFMQGLIASGQLALGGAGGVKDAVATGHPSPDATLVVRVAGDQAIFDFVVTRDGKPAPSPAELARRSPLAPARPFVAGRGARRLFTPDAAAVLYADGRRLGPLLTSVMADDARDQLRAASPGERPALAARQRNRRKECTRWEQAPALFDDVGLALSSTPDAATLTWAWGTAGGPPLGGLQLVPVDDAALDARGLARDAAGALALYAASLVPFGALKRSGVFASLPALTDAIDSCDTMAGAMLALRSWPLAIGTIMGAALPPESPLGALKQSLGTLRNLVVAVRDFSATGARFAVAASFDGAARPMLELMLVATGGSGAATTLGRRSPTVYSVQLPGLAKPAAAALESLAGNRIGFTVADSDESLAWAYRAGAPPAPVASLPLLRVDADAAALSRLAAALAGGSASPDEQVLIELIAKLRHVDGAVAADGDLLRLSLHAPLRP
jgi:hypothetical protein